MCKNYFSCSLILKITFFINKRRNLFFTNIYYTPELFSSLYSYQARAVSLPRIGPGLLFLEHRLTDKMIYLKNRKYKLQAVLRIRRQMIRNILGFLDPDPRVKISTNNCKKKWFALKKPNLNC